MAFEIFLLVFNNFCGGNYIVLKPSIKSENVEITIGTKRVRTT